MKKIMRNILLVVLILILFYLLFYRSMWIVKSPNVKVSDEQTQIGVSASFSMIKWTHSYSIKDRTMYIKVYTLAYFNPFSNQTGFEYQFSIDKGSNDFDRIYINGSGENSLLIWEK